MLEGDQPATAIEGNPDRVAANDPGVAAIHVLGHPAPGHLPDLALLARPDRREWAKSASGEDPPGLHLGKAERVTVEGDDVKLAPPRPVIALEDLEAAPDQVLGGQFLAQLSQLLA